MSGDCVVLENVRKRDESSILFNVPLKADPNVYCLNKKKERRSTFEHLIINEDRTRGFLFLKSQPKIILTCLTQSSSSPCQLRSEKVFATFSPDTVFPPNNNKHYVNSKAKYSSFICSQ